jgi:hypothetical protein
MECGATVSTLVPSPDRLAYAGELGPSTPVSDPKLERTVRRATERSGAGVLDLTVLALRDGQHVPVVTIASAQSRFVHEAWIGAIPYRDRLFQATKVRVR